MATGRTRALLLLIAGQFPQVHTQCSTTDALDVATDIGQCAELEGVLVSSGGLGTCEFELYRQGAYAGYCNLYCNHNLYDVVPFWLDSGYATCSSLLAVGYSCDAFFAPGMQFGVGGIIQEGMEPNTAGYCDFECGFCPSTREPAIDTCMAYDFLDTSNSAGSCALGLGAGTYTCTDHFHHGGVYTGQCNLACQLNFLEHPAAYLALGIGEDVVATIAAYLSPALGETMTPEIFMDLMVPPAAGEIGLCQQLIEAFAAVGVDACQTYFTQRALVFSLQYGMCDFSCGHCQPVNDIVYVAPTVAVPNCLTAGDCCSVQDASEYPGDNPVCATSLEAGIECGHLFAPDRLLAGQCDFACGYCAIDAQAACDNIDCGQNGMCTILNGLGFCQCDDGYIGGQCQFLEAECTASDPLFDPACCFTINHPTHLQSTIAELMSTSQDFWDYENGQGTCEASIAAGHSCENYMAPGRVWEGRCDFTCGYCLQTNICDFLDCGTNGNCIDGMCVCEDGWIGAACDYTEVQCSTTQECCTLANWTADNPDAVSGADFQDDGFAPYLLGIGLDVMDAYASQGIFATHCGHEAFDHPDGRCATYFAPGKEFSGQCDIMCGYCTPTCETRGQTEYCQNCIGNSLASLDVNCGYGWQLKPNAEDIELPSIRVVDDVTSCCDPTPFCSSFDCPDGTTHVLAAGVIVAQSAGECCQDVVDCEGEWSECNGLCHRTWQQSVAQQGGGAACPSTAEPACFAGHGNCTSELASAPESGPSTCITFVCSAGFINAGLETVGYEHSLCCVALTVHELVLAWTVEEIFINFGSIADFISAFASTIATLLDINVESVQITDVHAGSSVVEFYIQSQNASADDAFASLLATHLQNNPVLLVQGIECTIISADTSTLPPPPSPMVSLASTSGDPGTLSTDPEDDDSLLMAGVIFLALAIALGGGITYWVKGRQASSANSMKPNPMAGPPVRPERPPETPTRAQSTIHNPMNFGENEGLSTDI